MVSGKRVSPKASAILQAAKRERVSHTEEISKRLSLWAAFPLVVMAVQSWSWWTHMTFGGRLFSKLPSISIVVFLAACVLVPRSILKYLPDSAFIFIPWLLVTIILADKSLALFGHSDKSAMYGSAVFWFLSFGFLVSMQLSRDKTANAYQKWLLHFLVMFVAGYISSYMVLDISNPALADSLNFMIVLHSIVQADLGNFTFFDLYSQYGGYSFFFLPVLKVFGSSVTVITTAFAILNFFCLIMIWSIIKTLSRRTLVQVALYFATVYSQYFAISLWPGQKYFQVWPIRMFFPILVVWCISRLRFFHLRWIFQVATLTVITSWAIIWNFETGLVTLFVSSLAVFLSARNKIEKVCSPLLVALSSLTVIAQFLIIQIVLGRPFKAELFFRAILAFDGNQSLSLARVWLIVAFVYGASLIAALRIHENRNVFGAEEVRTSRVAIAVASTGLGLLQYHWRGGHDATLGAVLWPLFPSVAYLLLLNQKLIELPIQGRHLLDVAKRSLRVATQITWVTVISLAAAAFFVIQSEPLVKTTPRFWDLKRNAQMPLYLSASKDGIPVMIRVQDQIDGYKSPWQLRCEYGQTLKAAGNNERILYISSWDALLYMCSRSKAPVSWGNWWHAFYAKEFDEAIAKMRSGEIQYVVLDSAMFRVHDPRQDFRIEAVLGKYFELVSNSDVGMVFENGEWEMSTLRLFRYKTQVYRS